MRSLSGVESLMKSDGEDIVLGFQEDYVVAGAGSECGSRALGADRQGFFIRADDVVDPSAPHEGFNTAKSS